MTRHRAALVGLAMGLLASACAGVEPDATVVGTTPTTADETAPGEGTGGQMTPVDPELDAPISPMGDPSSMGTGQGGNSADDVMIAAALSVQEFWTRTYPEVYGEDFEEIQGGFWTYGPATPVADLPPCGPIASYDEIASNAFYCSAADLIAWDREELVTPHIDQFGEFAAAIIMAHEMGHAVQGRTGDFRRLPGIITELQADCFAGAWVADVVDGGSEAFSADLDELDIAIAGQIEIRDDPGSDPNDPSAHGSGFDRVSAFSDGIFEGAERCAAYAEADQAPVITERTFDFGDETGGDLDPAALLEQIVPDLDDFYTQLFTDEGRTWDPVDEVVLFDPATDRVACGDDELTEDEAEFAIFYCFDDDSVEIDAVGLIPALTDIGDFALGAELARQWAFSAQVQTGLTETSTESLLNADCLTGLYAGDLFFGLRDGSGMSSLSPGDLDEAIISFLVFSDSGDDASSPFERSDAFRTGFLGDLADCDALL